MHMVVVTVFFYSARVTNIMTFNDLIKKLFLSPSHFDSSFSPFFLVIINLLALLLMYLHLGSDWVWVCIYILGCDFNH